MLRTRIKMSSEPETGFGLVELMVAISIFAVILIGASITLGQSLRIASGNRSRSVAANLASGVTDTVQTTPFTQLPVGRTTSTRVVDGIPYTIVQDDEWVATSATA